MKGMEETMTEGLDALQDELRVSAGFVGSGWSKQDGFEEEEQSEEGCRGALGGDHEGGITAGSKLQDAKEREATILDGAFGVGGLLTIEGETGLAVWRGEPLKGFKSGVEVSDRCEDVVEKAGIWDG
jgi:hypothetical protein